MTPPPAISARRIGAERQPIAIAEHFHPDPAALRRAAQAAAFGPARRHYPGIRADLPGDYFRLIRPALQTILAGVFDHRGEIALIDASFSIVTTPPDRLEPSQRLPHVDAVDPSRIALVHYLGLADRDGTAFYRHRATGFETIDAARSPAYLAALNAELSAEPPAPGYMTGPTALFDPIAAIDAAYNRALVYRSAILHSGTISPDAALDPDPATGRLTVTAFLQLL